VLSNIENLKNNKACGEDEIINEYIKSTSNHFIHIYEKLFNIICDTGVLPQSWLESFGSSFCSVVDCCSSGP
jgi:hypothetical protein